MNFTRNMHKSNYEKNDHMVCSFCHNKKKEEKNDHRQKKI